MLVRQPAKLLGALVGFVTLGFVVVASPIAALAMLGCALLLAAFVARPSLLKLVVVALVLVPTAGIFRTRPKTEIVAVQKASAIESGSLPNKIAATLLFSIGVACVSWGRRHVRHVNFVPCIGMYLSLAFISMLWSQSVLLTLRRSVEALFITVFALGIGSFYYGRKPQGHIELIRTICWASSFMTFGVLVFAVFSGDLDLSDPAWRLGRVGVENQIAWVAAVGFLIAWATKTRRDIWATKAALWFNMAVPALVVLLTKSRQTWVGVLVGMFVVELLKPRPPVKRLAAVLVLGGVVGAVSYTSTFEQMWKRGANEQDIKTMSGRTQLWETAWPSIRSNLWLGRGFGAFWTGKTVLAFSSGWSPTSLHNGYLDTIGEVGLVGLVLMAVGVGVSALNAWRLMKHPKYGEVGLALLVLYASFLVMNAFGGVLEAFNYYPVTAILAYSFFVSYRLYSLTANQSSAGGNSPLS